MTLTQLKKLVLQGEGQYLEFKARANHPDKIVREMVAFANAKGGILLIGVGDQGQINGLKFADEDEFEMDQTILKYCQPMIAYHCVHVSVSADRHVLVYDIKESMEKPVYCLYDFKKQIGKAYLRMGDKSVLISAEMRQVLKNQRNTEGVKIFYGMRESALLKYFSSDRPQITLAECAQFLGISLRQASALLVRLTSAGVLKIFPQADGKPDYFSLSNYE